MTPRAEGHTNRRVAVVGGGIVGLATAWQLQRSTPGTDVVVFEKEDGVARHQSGRNSGVVHAGVYYEPGSLKARLCRSGMAALREFCAERDLAYRAVGKVVVATDHAEEARLRTLHERAVANGVPEVALIGPERLRELEPAVRGVAALHSPHTAVVDFGAVARALADEVVAAGGVLHLGAEVTGLQQDDHGVEVVAGSDTHRHDVVVNCAGLFADRVARLAGDDRDPQIVPFRGEYHQLRPGATDLVRGLVYPVPDPRYPFLGIHLTRTVDGRVLLGPNAVLALAREGYGWGDVVGRDLLELLGSRGMWALAARHWRTGLAETLRSLRTKRFLAAARRYVPALELADLEPAPSGVRAQAIEADGDLVDDFRFRWSGRVGNVRNAPSPAATSSLAIGRLLAEQVLARTEE